MAEIIFDKDFPEWLKPQVENLLGEFAWLLPTWLQRLFVGYSAEDADNSAKINVQKDWRFARLTFCASYIKNEDKIRRDDLAHELIHSFISPLKNYAVEVIEKLCKGDDLLFEIIKAELISRNEQVTQDFAYAITKFNESMGDMPK